MMYLTVTTFILLFNYSLNLSKHYLIEPAPDIDSEICEEAAFVRVGPSYHVGGKPLRVNISEAEIRCNASKAHLVDLNYRLKLDAVLKWVKDCSYKSTAGHFWVNGKRDGDTSRFFWGDKQEVDKKYWCDASKIPDEQPSWSNTLLFIEKDNFCFKAADDSAISAYICEKDY